MPHYIALIHKDGDSCYGVSFPDLPGVVSAGDTIDQAMQHATKVLAFAAEDWGGREGNGRFPAPRTIDQLRADPAFREDARDAVVAEVPFRASPGDDQDNMAGTSNKPVRLTREEFAKVSEVEGLRLSDDMKDAFAEFDRRNLTADQRRQSIIDRFKRDEPV